MHLLGIRLLQKFSGILDFSPEKSGCTNFRPEFFWFFWISNRKILKRSPRNPEKSPFVACFTTEIPLSFGI